MKESALGSSIDPRQVRALVRRLLEERLGDRAVRIEAHASHWLVTEGPGCAEEEGLSAPEPCVIEPHRPCYNSGYCKKLGH